MENNDEYNINYEYIVRYIRRTLKKSTGLIAEMEQFAHENSVPIAQPETIRFIETLIRFGNVKNVLEVGAAIGYSAVTMAQCGCTVTTIERSEEMLPHLYKNIEKSGHKNDITVYEGDAAEVLGTLSGQYDFIFLDAAKAQYLEFLPMCLKLLRPGGVIFSDNILYKGMVATDELFRRRKVTIIKRLRRYLDELCSRDDLCTSIIPVGDGAALSFYMPKE